MDFDKAPKGSDRPAQTERTRPIPNADRRRLVRKSDTAETPVVVITDWASI